MHAGTYKKKKTTTNFSYFSHSLLLNFDEALRFLKKSVSSEGISCNDIVNDPDLEDMREIQEFKKLVEGVQEREQEQENLRAEFMRRIDRLRADVEGAEEAQGEEADGVEGVDVVGEGERGVLGHVLEGIADLIEIGRRGENLGMELEIERGGHIGDDAPPEVEDEGEDVEMDDGNDGDDGGDEDDEEDDGENETASDEDIYDSFLEILVDEDAPNFSASTAGTQNNNTDNNTQTSENKDKDNPNEDDGTQEPPAKRRRTD